jgi:hypothetical protein
MDEFASSLSGTGIMSLGALFGYMGIVQGKQGEYSTKSYDYNQMQGSQDYSINFGDGGTYTLDWASPLSMPFFVGVELSKLAQNGQADFGAMVDSITSIQDPVFNMTMLQGMNTILKNNYKGIGETATEIGFGYLSQYNPTIIGQVARTIDPIRRSSRSTNESYTTRNLESFGRKQVGKIPLASKTMEPYVDLWGRDQKGNGLVGNFLSPGYYQPRNTTPVDKEINSLIGRLDEESANKIIPRATKNYDVTVDKKPYRMTEKELTQFQRTKGQESYNKLS